MAYLGTVKFFSDQKGFGFISTDRGDGDIFVHRSECQGGQPQDGDQVRFNIAQDDRTGRRRALNVTGGTAPLGPAGGTGVGGNHCAGGHSPHQNSSWCWSGGNQSSSSSSRPNFGTLYGERRQLSNTAATWGTHVEEHSPNCGNGSPNIALQKVYVIGDSVMRGLQKIFQNYYANRGWRVETNEGREALGIPCAASALEEYDHIIYCSAGNCLWKPLEWSNVERNINSFDPTRISVVFLGSAEYWARLAGERPPYMSFFEDAKHALHEKLVPVAELTTFIERLEYVDKEGHPTKDARWELVPQLMEVFQDVANRGLAQDMHY